MPPKLPKPVIDSMADRAHRMHHFLWHEVRNGWLSFSPDERKRIAALGWEPPRPARRTNANGASEPVLDNFSGEDFLYMHRNMISDVDRELAKIADKSYPKVEGWPKPPGPADKDWPVPAAYSLGDAGTDAYIKDCKSKEFYSGEMAQWIQAYTDPATLKRMSLGELGSRLEFTIHNRMHMRWSRKPARVRPDVDPEAAEVIDKRWDVPSYDWLGDTYSSHVNPVFWKLHGWVNQCVDLWMKAHGVQGPVPWKGTWVGPDMHDSSSRSLSPMPEHGMTGGHHHHGSGNGMLEVARVLRSSGVSCHFYDPVVVPPLPQ